MGGYKEKGSDLLPFSFIARLDASLVTPNLETKCYKHPLLTHTLTRCVVVDIR